MVNLSSPITIGRHNIKNRIVAPPLVVNGMHRQNKVTEELLDLYGAFAQSGCGTIIQEATCVLPEGRLAGDQLGLWQDEQIDGCQRIVDRCRPYDPLMLVQIHYASRQGEPDDVVLVGPSEYENKDGLHRALRIDEVERIRDGFVSAALRAEKAGYDGVELHGAHGYLLCAFMNSKLNRRDDRYGDTMALVREIYTGIRQCVKPNFLVTIRVGVDNPDMETGIKNCLEIDQLGFDMINVSSGMAQDEPVQAQEGFPFSTLTWRGCEIKKLVQAPVIAVGNLDDPVLANQLIAEGYANFAAVGRGMLADPHWAGKALGVDTTQINRCRKCKRCLWFSDHTKCPARRARSVD